MGVYVYRVTSEKVMCSDGVEANVAEYAYKPYGFFDQALNRKMHFASGAQASDNMAAKGSLTGRIAVNGRVYLNRDRVGSFYDSEFGSLAIESMPGVKAPEFPPKQLWRDVVKKGGTVDAEVAVIAESPGVKRCYSARLKREMIAGLSAVFAMECKLPGSDKPMTHTISVAQTDAERLAIHWAGFLQNCRARARELFNVMEAA